MKTRKWVEWFISRRLLEPIGNIAPAEAEESDCARIKELDMVAQNGRTGLR